jgi:hypothetical protein
MSRFITKEGEVQIIKATDKAEPKPEDDKG